MSGLIPAGDLAAMAATVNQLANATLTEVKAPGAPDRNGDPTTGTTVWSGSAPAWLSRERHDEVSGGEQVPVRMDTLTLTRDAAPVVEVAGPDWEASTITVIDNRTGTPVTSTFRVTGMEAYAAGLIDSVDLTLDEVMT